MKMFNKILDKILTGAAALALGLMLSVPSFAQVPSVAPPPFQPSTYSASGVLTVPQTAAGDAVCINGIASSTVHQAGVLKIKKISLQGTDSTAQSATVELVTRSTLDSGGTPGGTSNHAFTVTIAAPAVFTWTSNGLVNGQPVALGTSGALPTGLTAGQVYFVVAAATNTFELATTPGGAPVGTSGTQSGTQTVYLQSVSVPQDSGNTAAAYAGVVSFAAVPTAGTTVGPVETNILPLPDGATLLGVLPLVWGYDPQVLAQDIVLRGTTQSACVNFPNALTTAAASLRWKIEWTEQ